MSLLSGSLRLTPAAAATALKLALTVAAALIVVFALSGHAFGSEAPSQLAISDPTGFGSNVPEHVDPRPIERDIRAVNGYRLHRIPCAAASASTVRCYAATF